MMARGTARLLALKASEAIDELLKSAMTEHRYHLKGLVPRDEVLDLQLGCMQRINQIYSSACVFISDPLADAQAQRRFVSAVQRNALATIARQILSITSHG